MYDLVVYNGNSNIANRMGSYTLRGVEMPVEKKKKINICQICPWICRRPATGGVALSSPTPPVPGMPADFNPTIWLYDEEIAELERLSSLVSQNEEAAWSYILDSAEILMQNNRLDISEHVATHLLGNISKPEANTSLQLLTRALTFNGEVSASLGNSAQQNIYINLASLLDKNISP